MRMLLKDKTGKLGFPLQQEEFSLEIENNQKIRRWERLAKVWQEFSEPLAK